MSLFREIVLSVIVVTFSSSAFSSVFNKEYYELDEAQVSEVQGAPITSAYYEALGADFDRSMRFSSLRLATNPSTQGFSAGDIVSGLGDIVNLGKFIWGVIEYNKPVANLSSDFANAVPRNVESWEKLAGWSQPEVKTYNVVYKNKYGKKVVDFTYQVLYSHSGNMKGIGQYIANMTTIPTEISVTWGFKLTAGAQVPYVTNIGTLEAPLASSQLHLKWRAESVLSHKLITKAYVIQGNGDYKDISDSPEFQELQKQKANATKKQKKTK